MVNDAQPQPPVGSEMLTASDAAGGGSLIRLAICGERHPSLGSVERAVAKAPPS